MQRHLLDALRQVSSWTVSAMVFVSGKLAPIDGLNPDMDIIGQGVISIFSEVME